MSHLIYSWYYSITVVSTIIVTEAKRYFSLDGLAEVRLKPYLGAGRSRCCSEIGRSSHSRFAPGAH